MKAMKAAAAFVVAALAALAAEPAQASAFQTHTYQADLPLRLVERPLVVGKGVLQLSAGFDWKQSSSYFTGDDDEPWNFGAKEGEDWRSYSNGATWSYRQFHLDVDWGFTKNSQLFLRIPFVWAHVGNENGADLTAWGLGDVRLGVRQQIARRIDPEGKANASLAAGLELKTPTGNESPGSYLSSPGNLTYVPIGTGTYNLTLDVLARQQAGPIAIQGRAGFVARFSSVVQYLVEDQENQFNMRVDPGDGIEFDIGVIGQLGPYVALSLDFQNEYRLPTRQGSTAKHIDPCHGCAEIEGSSGFWSDLRGGVSVSPSNRLQIDGFVAYTLAGKNSTFYWPLEDISPSRGVTAGGDVAFRF